MQPGRRRFLEAAAALAWPAGAAPEPVPDKTVVLTFDDSVKSHRTFVGPLLAELSFGATFFVTHRWMNDTARFMSWEEIAELHRMGFEIGNHSWTHADFSVPWNAARLAGELALVENELRRVGVPAPVSFAYSGNFFGPEAVAALGRLGYKFARRGGSPEVEYGKVVAGPAYRPDRHHPLLIPTTGDAYPDWTFEHFRNLVSQAADGGIVVLQFHGVPDEAHPWVHTPPESFRRYMRYLKENGFRAIAVRDLERWVSRERPPADPTLGKRHREPRDGRLRLPVEMEATRAQLDYWLANMGRHGYTPGEIAEVTGLGAPAVSPSAARASLAPYPGGRHPRIGFLEGAIDPRRGSKASVFLDRTGYVVVDLPEAVFAGSSLLFLAHTHVPTVWDSENTVIENVDWTRRPDGSLASRWTLPNRVAIGASIASTAGGAAMELWVENGSLEPLRRLRAQVCVLLKAAPGFAAQTDANKLFRSPVAAARSASGDRWILTAWENAGRLWGNAACPCFHCDPLLGDCAPGETARVRGRLWFYEGRDIEAELARGRPA